ncbi:MAG TPA: universal stress protein [Alphaproteobacteria bacterium]|nr:universal stress protein [Alphaproteobacteria bacterium]
MAYKDLLVHLNDSKHRARRLDLAARLAEQFDAHLIGLYTVPDLYVPGYLMAQMPADLMAVQQGAIDRARDAARAEFETRVRGGGIEAEWRALTGEPSSVAAMHARYADLAVVGQGDPDEHLMAGEDEVPERVVLESGRPTLVIPYAGKFPKLGERVLVAWNASAPATRAVNDALPLMSNAKKVTILAINPEGGDSGHGEVPGADIALHLARHGIKAEASHVFADDIDVGDMILSRASDEGVDLIVMGAYGHARMRELVLGGATRDIFQHMTVPVLMSH